jgi:hypothetical protein
MLHAQQRRYIGAYILIIMAIATDSATPLSSRPAPSDGKWPLLTMQRFEDVQACNAAISVIKKDERQA